MKKARFRTNILFFSSYHILQVQRLICKDFAQRARNCHNSRFVGELVSEKWVLITWFLFSNQKEKSDRLGKLGKINKRCILISVVQATEDKVDIPENSSRSE